MPLVRTLSHPVATRSRVAATVVHGCAESDAVGALTGPSLNRVLTENSSNHSRHRCPQCGSRVKRVLRTANDKRRWDAEDFRRYRCRSDTCGWQGLLQVGGRTRLRSDSKGQTSVLARASMLAAGALLAAGVAWGAVAALVAMLDL